MPLESAARNNNNNSNKIETGAEIRLALPYSQRTSRDIRDTYDVTGARVIL